MKSAFLLANDPQLFSHVKEVLVNAGGSGGDAHASLEEEGRLLLVSWQKEPTWYDFEWKDPPDAYRGEGEMPDLSAASCCYLECRWEVWLAEWLKRIDAALPVKSWLLDSNGVLWPADSVDPNEVVL